ncbi:helix-turn-helix domain-containing protein [Vibrio cholerae]|nr:helix-turn-helix domain-containing protein [Vibrio cholerae]
MIDFKGSQIGWKELSERFGIPVSTLFNRYQSGLRNDDLVSSHHRGTLNKRAASKLTEYEVRAIKRKLEAGKLTQAAIAKQFNVHQSHISDIKRGKRWAEIEI